MIDGEGHTIPERVGLRGVNNAANPVLACLPCALVVLNCQGGAPYQKKKKEAKAPDHSKINQNSRIDLI